MTFVYFLTSETLLHVLEYLLSSFKEQFHQCFSIMYFLQEKKMLWASLRYLGAGAAHCWAHLYRWASSYTYLSEVLAGGVTAQVFSVRESRSVSLTERSYWVLTEVAASSYSTERVGVCHPRDCHQRRVTATTPPGSGTSVPHLTDISLLAVRAACGSVTSWLSANCPGPRWMYCPQQEKSHLTVVSNLHFSTSFVFSTKN